MTSIKPPFNPNHFSSNYLSQSRRLLLPHNKFGREHPQRFDYKNLHR